MYPEKVGYVEFIFDCFADFYIFLVETL